MLTFHAGAIQRYFPPEKSRWLVPVYWLLFAIPAGLIVDGVDRRLALAISNTLRTLLAALLFVLALTGSLSIWTLYLVIFLYGIGETIYDGAIRAVVPSLVPKAQLPTANGRIEAAAACSARCAARSVKAGDSSRSSET